MQLTQEYMEMWTDSVRDAWYNQPSPEEVTRLSDWSCVAITIAVIVLLGFLGYFAHKEEMERLRDSTERKHDKKARESSQQGQQGGKEVSEG